MWPSITRSGPASQVAPLARRRAFLAKSFGSWFVRPRMVWSSRSSSCWSSVSRRRSRQIARGTRWSRTHSAAAVPAACPTTAQVAMTRVEVKATCEQLMLRPAIMRLWMFRLYSERSGML